MEKYSQVFADVADFLTRDNWIKFNQLSNDIEYFVIRNDKICFSAYAAVKARLIPALIAILDESDTSQDLPNIVRRANQIIKFNSLPTESPTRGDECMRAHKNDPIAAWANRNYILPCGVAINLDCDVIINGVNHGKRQPLFIMGMAGLSIGFHNVPTTTLEMVKEKLLYAAEIATKLEL